MPLSKKLTGLITGQAGSDPADQTAPNHNKPNQGSSSPQTQANLVAQTKVPNQERELILKWEERLAKWEESLQEEKSQLQDQVKGLEKKSQSLKELEDSLLQLKREYQSKLEEVAGLSNKVAEEKLLTELSQALKEEIAKRIRQAEEEIKSQADEKSKEILLEAMSHGFTNYINEYTISEVKLPDPDMKGRVIGRDGRNIRALENLTGVDVEIDEEGPVIRLSSFDPVRREIARVALQKLIKDRRIQPSRIEEVVNLTKAEIDRVIWKAGEDLCHQVGVYSLSEDKVKLLGRFKFRFSYGQNLLSHTLEETKIGLALAHELGANLETVRLGCLLHDIGKVLTEQEGTHVDKGVELLKKNNLPQAVIDCVAQHHEDQTFSSVEAIIVYLADAISGARPGARYESYDDYVKRISVLEEIAKGFAGVAEAYAIQAGRELRVIVKADKIDDAGLVILAKDIRDALEKNKVGIPGNVKVTVIREVRASETAQT